MAKTNTGLVAYAKAQIGKPYWYGTFGQTATANLLETKARQYPSQYGGNRVKYATTHHLKQRVHDCVGLIKGYLWSDSATATPKYKSSQDVSANGMYNLCKKKGAISSMPDVAGVLVFMDKHIGVYIGGGEVVEAMGFDYGVRKTKLKDRKWTKWGYCPFIEYTEQTSTANKTSTTNKTSTANKTTQSTPTASGLVKGKKLTLKKTPLYASSTSKTKVNTLTGTYYLYDGKAISGRYRITNAKVNCGKSPLGKYVTGYVNKSDID